MRSPIASTLPTALCLLLIPHSAYSQEAKPLVITGELTAKDPFDGVRHHKVHELELKAGEGYIIDLRSSEFDTFLLVEDAAGRKMGENDNVNTVDRNSRVAVEPTITGTYRAIVTSFLGGKTGKYTLAVRTASPELIQEERWRQEASELNERGVQLLNEGKYKAALASLQRALELTEKAYPGSRHLKGHPDFASRLNNLALVYRSQADYAKAEPLFKQSLEIYRQVLGEKHAGFATSLHNLALLYESQGDYAKAEPLYKQSLEIRRQVLGEKHRDFATSLSNLAGLYESQGDYAKAEPLFKQSLEIYRQVLGEKHPDFATCLSSFAVLYESQGDYAKAEPLFTQSLEIRRQVLGEKHPDFAASLADLAGLYRSQGNYAKAEPLYKQSLEIHRQVLGEKHRSFASSLNSLALLYRSQGDYAKAEPLYKQSLEICRQVLGEKHPDFATSLNNLAVLYRSQGDYAKAEPLYKQSLEIRRQVLGEKHPDFGRSLNNLALLYRSQGDYAKAERLGREATEIMREHLEGSALVQSERQQIVHREKSDLYYHNYLRTTARMPDAAKSAYDLVLSWKGSVTARQRLTRVARTDLDKNLEAKVLFHQLDSIARQISVWSAKGPTKGVDLPKKLADLIAEREAIETKLSACTEAFRRFKDSQKLTTAELQKHFPEGTVLVDFVEYDGDLGVFIITKDQIARVELGSTKPLREAADRFRQTMKRASPLSGKDDPAQILREKVLDPLDKYLAGAKLLLIAPDGPLHSLPFAALPGKAPGTYLIEEVPVAVIPVPQMLPELLAKRSPSGESAPSLLALGDVDFDVNPIAGASNPEGESWKRRRAGSQQNWDRLPGTRGEILAIEDTFRKAVPQGKLTVLRDAQPTEAAVRKLASSHEYLHFATHGFFAGQEVKSALKSATDPKRGFESETPTKVIGHHPGLLSGIVLAGANKPKDDDDGVLTALEVSELDLTKVELAVLSACETGLGEVAGGEGVLGLQRAFQIAGARTTITSLWKVDDDATRKLMERFYDNYWKKKMGTLEALREAQLWMLREAPQRGIVRLDAQESTGRTPPYYWAAFVLSGDWR